MTNTNTTTPATMAGPLTLLQAADVARWYDEFAPHLHRILAAHLLNRAQDATDIDDVIQETFIRLMRHVTEVAALDSAHRRNYVMKTARWIASDRYRYGQRHMGDATPLSALTETHAAEAEPLTASHAWQAERLPEQTTAVRMSLRAVWDETPAHYCDVLLLLVAGATPAEMAHALHLTQHAVAVRVHRLRTELRDAAERIA